MKIGYLLTDIFPETPQKTADFPENENRYKSTAYETFSRLSRKAKWPNMTVLENLENIGISGKFKTIINQQLTGVFPEFQIPNINSKTKPHSFQKCGSLLRECRFWNKGRADFKRKRKNKNQGVLNADR